jgi:Mg2+/Co2+ transporter CorB
MLGKTLKFAFLTLMAYLLQACVAQRIAIGGIAPNLAMALIAIISVALGRKYTFVMSMTVGYLLELMLPALTYINMIAYPVCCILGAMAFSDKSERKLEEERTLGKNAKQLHPHIRTILCALLSISVYEFINVFYTYLTGVALAALPFGRAITDIIYTTVLAAVLQFPVRWWLGIYKLNQAR